MKGEDHEARAAELLLAVRRGLTIADELDLVDVAIALNTALIRLTGKGVVPPYAIDEYI